MFALNLLRQTSIQFRKCLVPEIICYEQVRSRGSKHWNPKFRKLRRLKTVWIDLPDSDDLKKSLDDINKEDVKAKMKERGVLPDRPWSERPMFISSTGAIFEAYVPPEGDGKVSIVTPSGAKQKLEFIEKKGKSMMAVRKIRSFEEEFEFWSFLEEAQKIYVEAHTAMINKNRDKLIEFVTERAYPEIVTNIGDKTLKWSFLESIEPARVVHARCTDVISKDNIFGQLTVRFHTRQILSIYDRFGRLMLGSEETAKDVLEYIVFEKHLSNQYGRWRIHAKIIPDWMPPPEPGVKTFITGSTSMFDVPNTALVTDTEEKAMQMS